MRSENHGKQAGSRQGTGERPENPDDAVELVDEPVDLDEDAGELRECELAECSVRFPRRGKKKFCTKEHANESARRRTVLETLAVDVPLEELRALRDEVLDRVGPSVTALAADLTGVLERFAALETGAVARIAGAEKAAAAAAAAAQNADRLAATAADREAAAAKRADEDRAARADAERAQAAAERHAHAATEDRVRAETLKDAAVLAAAHADTRADLAAEATLEAAGRAAKERARADALQVELDRTRTEHLAEVRRLREEARATATAVQERADAVHRQLGEQTNARIDGLRTQHNTEIAQLRTTTAAEVAAARAETDRAHQRHLDAVREVETERARGQAARDRLLRDVRRALGTVLDVQDGVDMPHARARQLHDGVTAVLRQLDDLDQDDERP